MRLFGFMESEMMRGGGKMNEKRLKQVIVLFEIGAVVLIILRLIVDNIVINRICNIEVLVTCIIHIAYYWRKNSSKKR